MLSVNLPGKGKKNKKQFLAAVKEKASVSINPIINHPGRKWMDCKDLYSNSI